MSKSINLCGLLVVGTLALFTVSCREENRNENDDGYRTARGDRDDRVRYDLDRDNNNYRQVSYTSTSSGREMLIGDGDKVWKARMDINEKGTDEALERRGEFHFYGNNSFTFTESALRDNERTVRTGTWQYTGSTLSIKYAGDPATYTYAVRELTDDKMRLGAYDGSELVLVDKDIDLDDDNDRDYDINLRRDR